MNARKIANFIRPFVPKKLRAAVRSLFLQSPEGDSFFQKTKTYRSIPNLRKKYDDIDYQLVQLRMHAHALDKSLHYENWDSGRGRYVYDRAVEILEKCRITETERETVDWAMTIIEDYSKRQESPAKKIAERGFQVTDPPLSPDALFDLLAYRRSCRSFTSRKVKTETVKLIVSAALEAPASCSRQTLKVYATTDCNKAKKYSEFFHGCTCFSEHIPSLLIFCADLRPYSFPTELFIPTLDTALAVQNAALMASSMGLSITQLIWASDTKNEQSLRSCFEIPEYVEIVVGAVCGYPNKYSFRPARKSIDSTLSII